MNQPESAAPAVEQSSDPAQSDESVQELVAQVSHLVTQFEQIIPLLERAQEQESEIAYIALVPSEDGSESTAILIPTESGDLDQEKWLKSIGKAIKKVNWGKVAKVVGGAVKGGLGGIAGGPAGIVAGAALGGLGATKGKVGNIARGLQGIVGAGGGIPGIVKNVAGGIPGIGTGAAGGIPGIVAGVAAKGIAGARQRRAARNTAPQVGPGVQQPVAQPRPSVRQQRPAPTRPQVSAADRLRQAQQLYAAARQQLPQLPQAPEPEPEPTPAAVAQGQAGWDPAMDPNAGVQGQ
ncbi:MAG TPA: hypothetical protein VNM90_22675, partial [Haliangium sp.]|nr:hypothetical protein [Haliangium sp.]